MANMFAGAQPPGEGGPPKYDVIAPQPGETFDLTFINDLVVGVWTHWVWATPDRKKGRSWKCYKDEEGECELCGKQRRQWLGWIAVAQHPSKTKAVLRMAGESANVFKRIIGPSGKPRGRRLEVSRPRGGKTTALTFYDNMRPALDPLPPEFNVAPTVCLVLGCESIDNTTFAVSELEGRADEIPFA